MAWFHKYIFSIGKKRRNPSLNNHYLFLKKTEKWSKQELEKLQWNRLKEILHYAYNHSGYYRQVWDKAGISPDDIQAKEDLAKIPIVTKKDLIKYNEEIHSSENFKKKFFSVTSGTTGQSLSFWKDENADSWNRAAIFRGYSWYNVKPWEFNGYFWGFDFSLLKKLKTRLLDFLVNRYRLFGYSEDSFNKFVYKLKNAKYLEGYSSAIYQTAKLINEKKLPKPSKLKMVKGTSEKIYPHYQEEVKQAFGKKMISEYGAAEAGLIAYECPHGSLHIVTEGVYIEEIENKIVVTNLVMRSFPIIRYELGDYVRLKPKEYECTCGMKHPVIEEITGRVGKNIYGRTGIYPSLYFYYIFKNMEKNSKITTSYQVVQKEKGKLEFYIMKELNDVERQNLKAEIVKMFGKDIEFTIHFDKNLLSNKKKKFRDFISYLE